MAGADYGLKNILSFFDKLPHQFSIEELSQLESQVP